MQLCREINHTLSGGTQTYSCELLHFEPGFGILRYVVEREYDIAGYRLLPDDVTYALYWEDRPYTLYVWDLGRINCRLYYFNIADSVSLRPQEFVWRDLAIDILIDADGQPHMLDEHELPRDLDRRLGEYIQKAAALITMTFRDLIKEANNHIAQVR